MTYRDPDAPLPADAPTEAYRTGADGTPVTPATPPGAAPEGAQAVPASEPAPTAPAPAAAASLASGPGDPPAQAGWPSAGAAATTQPVAGPGPRRGLRWAVAIVVVALVVTTVAAAAFIMAGKAPDAAVLRWVPTDSIIYAEARLDLPGDQRAKLGEFLSKFPGFRDQSTLETKINEVLDRAVSGASNGEQTYSADLAPWFGGEIAFSMGELPSMSDLSNPEAAMAVPEVVTFVSLKDDAKAKAWIDDVIEDASTTTEDYNGTELTLISMPDAAAAGSNGAYAIPTDSKVLIAGQVDAVKAALDTKGASGLAADAGFSAALAASDEDHVGFMYMNMRSYMDWAMDMSGAAGADVCGSTPSPELLAMVPDWMGMRLRIEGDALVMDAAGPLPESLAEKPTNRPSTIAARVPASTIALIEGHDIGKGVLDAIEIYRSDPACADAVKQVESVVGMLGGFDDLVGWIGDAAIVINRTDDGVEGGLVVQTDNADDASDLLATLRSFVALGGSSAGMSIREETHGDTTITILDAGDASSLFGLAGMGAGMTVEPPGGPGSHVELAWAVTDDMVVLSVGPNFIKHVLDTDEAGSLAANGRFDSLIQRTGKDNVGIVFADLSAMRELVEGAVAEDADALAKYEAEVKPFLLPFDAYVQSTSVGGELSQTRAVITVK